MYKERIIAIAIFAIMTSALKAQIRTASWHDGYWGQWTSHSSSLGHRFNEFSLYGNYSGFLICKKNAHPSEYILKFQANSYSTPDKKTIKYHFKKNVWYEYSGIVEYYVTEDYPTITDILKRYDFPYFNCNSGSAGNPCVKRTAIATIKIAPYKKHPECYNLYFDNVAIGISLEGVHF